MNGARLKDISSNHRTSQNDMVHDTNISDSFKKSGPYNRFFNPNKGGNSGAENADGNPNSYWTSAPVMFVCPDPRYPDPSQNHSQSIYANGKGTNSCCSWSFCLFLLVLCVIGVLCVCFLVGEAGGFPHALEGIIQSLNGFFKSAMKRKIR